MSFRQSFKDIASRGPCVTFIDHRGDIIILRCTFVWWLETGATNHQEDKGVYPGASEIQEETGFDASKGLNEISALKA